MTPEEALDLVDLGDRLDHFPSQMSAGRPGGSGGRKSRERSQNVPRLSSATGDPTGALDVETGVTVLEAIEKVNLDLGTLTVLITRNAVVAEMADPGHPPHGRQNFPTRPSKTQPAARCALATMVNSAWHKYWKMGFDSGMRNIGVTASRGAHPFLICTHFEFPRCHDLA